MFGQFSTGPEGERGKLIEHPHWQDASNGTVAAPQAAGGLALMRGILDAQVGAVMRPDPALLTEVFYSGESTAVFTGEVQDDEAWSVLGSGFIAMLVDHGVLTDNGDGSYLKSTVGFGENILGPSTWCKALAGFVCDKLDSE